MSGECETCGNHTLECECEQSPERIWIEQDDCPYFYYESELADVGSPVIEYVRADLFNAVKAERDEQYRRADTLAQQNAYHKERAKKAEAERDGLLAALKDVLSACDKGRMVSRGICGMTFEAKIRNIVINGIPAWPIEEARALIERIGGRDV